MRIDARVRTGLPRASAAMVLAWAATGLAIAADVDGAGASFPAPLYLRWAEAYRLETGIAVGYEAVGSGTGVEWMRQGRIDFAGTDDPLPQQALRDAGLVQFPVVIGGVVPVVNLAGTRNGELRLTGELLADIYLGKLRRWNDRAIADLNPGLDLPATNITVVHRSDASGTTRLWSGYLSKADPRWRAAIGSAQTLNWPVGVAGVGNEGVASLVRRTRAAIGYVEYAYAKKHRLSVAALRNREGLFVQPSSGAFAAAAESADRLGGAHAPHDITDAPGPASWPIAGISFVLLPAAGTAPERTQRAAAFFAWARQSGRQAAVDLDYVPVPAASAEAAPRSLEPPQPAASMPRLQSR